MEVDGAERGALEGTGRRTLDELLGAKPELLEPSERRTLDPSDILRFSLGMDFGSTCLGMAFGATMLQAVAATTVVHQMG